MSKVKENTETQPGIFTPLIQQSLAEANILKLTFLLKNDTSIYIFSNYSINHSLTVRIFRKKRINYQYSHLVLSLIL